MDVSACAYPSPAAGTRRVRPLLLLLLLLRRRLLR
jgi:hypothetical protein